MYMTTALAPFKTGNVQIIKKPTDLLAVLIAF